MYSLLLFQGWKLFGVCTEICIFGLMNTEVQLLFHKALKLTKKEIDNNNSIYSALCHHKVELANRRNLTTENLHPCPPQYYMLYMYMFSYSRYSSD